MSISKKPAALAMGFVALMSAASLAQNPAGARAPSPGETLAVTDCTVDWLEKSDVAALREGVVKKMEAQVGHEVREGQRLGFLHDEMAQLKVKRAKLAAENVANIKKSQSQKELAQAVLARSLRLQLKGKNFVSDEEVQKNEAEVKVADSLVLEAQENKKIAESELELTQQELLEHTIKAPFAGVITERMKYEGESVRANEAVVRLVRIDRVRVVGWVPLEQVFRVKVGMPVEVRPNIPAANLPIELKKFPGKITFIDAEAEPSESKVRVIAEVENSEDRDARLLPGLRADMLIFLNAPPVPATPPTTVGAKCAAAPVSESNKTPCAAVGPAKVRAPAAG